LSTRRRSTLRCPRRRLRRKTLSSSVGPITRTPLVTVRRPVPTDVEFMLKTWLREYRRAMPRAFPDRLYYNEFQKIILALTRKSNARVVCTTNDPNFIVGFLVGDVYPEYETAVVHFAYMRPPFRRYGFARQALLDMAYQDGYEIIATHWTPYMDRFRIKQLIHNPYVLYKVE
jgi:hypothetical protein